MRLVNKYQVCDFLRKYSDIAKFAKDNYIYVPLDIFASGNSVYAERSRIKETYHRDLQEHMIFLMYWWYNTEEKELLEYYSNILPSYPMELMPKNYSEFYDKKTRIIAKYNWPHRIHRYYCSKDEYDAIESVLGAEDTPVYLWWMHLSENQKAEI